MFAITIKADNRTRRLLFETLSIEIGRVQENDVVLESKRVSKRHAKISLSNDRFLLADLNSANGVFVNNKRISGPCFINAEDKVGIADFALTVALSNLSTLVDQKDSKETTRQYIPTLSSIRRLVRKILVTDPLFDAFCLDYFPLIKRHFAQGMDRISKENLLLEIAEINTIMDHLRNEYAEAYKMHQSLLIYESHEMEER